MNPDRVVVVTGAPGAGKHTAAAFFELPGFHRVSLREAVRARAGALFALPAGHFHHYRDDDFFDTPLASHGNRSPRDLLVAARQALRFAYGELYALRAALDDPPYWTANLLVVGVTAPAELAHLFQAFRHVTVVRVGPQPEGARGAPENIMTLNGYFLTLPNGGSLDELREQARRLARRLRDSPPPARAAITKLETPLIKR